MAGNLTDQIAKKIEENIIRGVWKPGEYIPAMRMLAEQEGVSRGIITAAISILVGKGCLERIPRHGIMDLSINVQSKVHPKSNISVKVP